MNYEVVRKGRGVHYIVGEQLFNKTGQSNDVIWVRCCNLNCGRTGKLHGENFHEIVKNSTPSIASHE
jgi:hypothetical protein